MAKAWQGGDANGDDPVVAMKRIDARYSVALFNSGDPRGSKVGGIETYIRDYIEYHPADMDLLFVGADESGLLPLDRVSDVTFRGRTFKFLPLFHLDSHAYTYGEGIMRSDTWRFARLLWKKRKVIRAILQEGHYSAELRRVEYAPFLWWMGVPVVQMVHIWGDKGKPMSSALGKHWYIRDGTEFLAAALARKFYLVNADMTALYKRKYRMFANKFDTLTTWANPAIFRATPYDFSDDTIRIVYAGRLDIFKRPDMMFAVVAAAASLRPGRVRFHYMGDGDPEVFAEFAAIRDITSLHGVCRGNEVSRVFDTCHIGILTSEFEGMPRAVMESLTSGRPVVALHLPQLEDVIVDGRSGYLVPRGTDAIAVQAERIVALYDDMKGGSPTPDEVASTVAAYRPQVLLSRIWNEHRRIHELPT